MIGTNVTPSYSNNFLLVKRLHPDAVLPKQADGDVGFDMTCVEEFTISPQSTKRVKTGWAFAESPEPIIVENKIIAQPFLKAEGRSGMASNGVFPVGGIIDPRYRGEVEIVLFNSTDKPVTYAAGSRVAQLVCYLVLANSGPYLKTRFLETNEVKQTDRGDKGFGSSGT